MQVEKRDGRIVNFDQNKIYNALIKCFNETRKTLLENDFKNIKNLTNSIVDKLTKQIYNVEEIQDIVENELIKQNFANEAKQYIIFRNTRSKQRDSKNTLTKILKNVIADKSTTNDLKRENANIDADTSMGTMLKIGSETAKDFALKYLINPKFATEHLNGDIHIHDLDFYPITMNCLSSDDKIIVITPNNEKLVVNAGFFEKFGPGSTELKGWKILSRNNEFVDLTHVHIRKETNINNINSLYSNIKLTDNHIVPIIRDGNYIEVKACDLKQSDIFETPEIDFVGAKTVYNIIDEIDDDISKNIFIKNDKKLKDILKKEKKYTDYINLLNSYTNRKRNYSRLMSLFDFKHFRELFKKYNICESEFKLKLKNSRNCVPSLYNLTSEFGWLLGMIYAEGNIGKDCINISNKDEKIILKIQEIVKNNFPEVKIGSYVHKNGVKCVLIFSKTLAFLCKKYLMQKENSTNMRLPLWYFNSNTDFVGGLIGGWIDGDGSISKDFDVRTVSASEEFINDAQTILAIHNIKTSKRVYKADGQLKTCCGNTFKNLNDNFELRAPFRRLKSFIRESFKFDAEAPHAYQYCQKNAVKTITKEIYDGFVYDFTTSNHYFWCNGIIVHNCMQIPLGKLLERGFNTGHGNIRKPQSILTASALACIILQANQNEMYGGQSFPMWEYDLAPYVSKSFFNHFLECFDDEFDTDVFSKLYKDTEICEKYVKNHKTILDKSAKEYLKLLVSETDENDKTLFVSGDNYDSNVFEKLYQRAIKKTDKETHQAMQAVIHNLNTMQCLPEDEEVVTLNAKTVKNIDKMSNIEKDAFKELLINLYKSMTIQEIADELQSSKKVIFNIFKKFGIELRNKK